MKIEIIGPKTRGSYQQILQIVDIPDDPISFLLVNDIAKLCDKQSMDDQMLRRYCAPLLDKLRTAHRNLTEISRYVIGEQ